MLNYLFMMLKSSSIIFIFFSFLYSADDKIMNVCPHYHFFEDVFFHLKLGLDVSLILNPSTHLCCLPILASDQAGPCPTSFSPGLLASGSTPHIHNNG